MRIEHVSNYKPNSGDFIDVLVVDDAKYRVYLFDSSGDYEPLMHSQANLGDVVLPDNILTLDSIEDSLNGGDNMVLSANQGLVLANQILQTNQSIELIDSELRLLMDRSLGDYYTKEETYNREEITTLIANATAGELTPEQVAAIVDQVLVDAGTDIITSAALAQAIAELESKINNALSSGLDSKQNATTESQIGKVLTGGNEPGTFGTINVIAVPESTSQDLVTSEGIWTADQDVLNAAKEYTDDSTAGLPTTTDIERIESEIESISSLSLPEAPEDGKQYARKDGEWSEVSLPSIAESDPIYLSEKDSLAKQVDLVEVMRLFTEHVQGDELRWISVNERLHALEDFKASIEQKVLDPEQKTDIESLTQSTGYTVEGALGGMIEFTGVTVLFIPAQVFINGIAVWSSSGLIGGGSDSRIVEPGDVITTDSITSIYYTPYIPKPEETA